MPQYLLMVTRDRPDMSPAAVGSLAGRLALWVEALRRWRLLDGVAVDEAAGQAGRAAAPLRGCLLVTASDLQAARRLAASSPAGAGRLLVLRYWEAPSCDR